MCEQPRPAVAAPAYHNKVAACFSVQSRRSDRTCHVTVAYDGNFYRLLDLTDNIPIGFAVVHLIFCTPMNGYRCRSRLLQSLGKLHSVDVLLVPALTDFGCDWDRNGIHSRLDYLRRKLGILHQSGPCPVSRDLGNGAAHIYVDNIGTILHKTLCRLGNKMRIVPEKLKRIGPLAVKYSTKLLSPAVGITKTLCGNHFRHHIGRAVFLAQRAVGSVRYRRHWRKSGSLFNFYAAY